MQDAQTARKQIKEVEIGSELSFAAMCVYRGEIAYYYYAR